MLLLGSNYKIFDWLDFLVFGEVSIFLGKLIIVVTRLRAFLFLRGLVV